MIAARLGRPQRPRESETDQEDADTKFAEVVDARRAADAEREEKKRRKRERVVTHIPVAGPATDEEIAVNTLRTMGLGDIRDAPPGAYSLLQGSSRRGAHAVSYGRQLIAQYASGAPGIARRVTARSHRDRMRSALAHEHETAFQEMADADMTQRTDGMGYSGLWATRPTTKK
jgi:hypothetical protein